MRNRKGFTLMELLLVVAVLAIVAAAAAPTFFGGAAEAINEAKRSQFLSAYQNVISGANVMMSIEAAKGNVLNKTQFGTEFPNFVPAAARTFNNGTAERILSANISTDNEIIVYSGAAPVVATASWDMIKNY